MRQRRSAVNPTRTEWSPPPTRQPVPETRALFQRYRRHEVLTPTCARHIRRAGLWLVVPAGVQLILPTLTVLLLTASNPPGERMLSVSLSSQSLGFVLAGGFLTVIGCAMAEAARAAEENAGFI